jgi:solute:Na+ symporter, SSS family
MVLAAATNPIQLHLSWVDYSMIIVYFAVVIGIGFTARRQVRTSMDFFLSGRSMPAWITGLAFVSANLGATEILGMAANGAQIGMSTLHYYLVGAVPAMVFLGLVMMPFYYGSKVRSVPEFMLRRFGKAPHVVNAIAFAVSNVLIAGINLYAMAIVIEAMLGWKEWIAIIVSAGFVLVYITLGGLSSAIYNEVMQFFVIIAGLVPLTIVGLHRVGGWSGLTTAIKHTQGVEHLSAWAGTAIGHTTNPIGANWLAIVLGLGFVLGFGYWTTNFTEVQRAFSAKNMSAARRTPLIAAFPKLFIPAIVVIPGLIAAATIGNQFADPHSGLTYNDAIPKLIQMYLPTGVLGVAVTGLLASFMAGMAANVSSFNTVFTYDIWQRYIKPNMPDKHYLTTGRWVTVAGIVVGIATAFIAAQAQNIMTYMQTLFSFFNAPLFAVFIMGLLWKRMTNAGALWGYIAGIVAPSVTFVWYLIDPKLFQTATAETMYGAIISFVASLVVGGLVSFATKPKPVAELSGLVYGVGKIDMHGDSVATDTAWYRSPALLGTVALVLCVVLYLPFL